MAHALTFHVDINITILSAFECSSRLDAIVALFFKCSNMNS